jgi:hypothetical protein
VALDLMEEMAPLEPLEHLGVTVEMVSQEPLGLMEGLEPLVLLALLVALEEMD